MSGELTPRRGLESLKKEAKRWLKALLAGDTDARARFTRAFPDTTAVPTLRDVQHALALENGFPGWNALKLALGNAAPKPPALDQRISPFLEGACPDHHVRGGWSHAIARDSALQILESDPDIARANLFTAVVCGEIDLVDRLLNERAGAANTKSGAATRDRSGVGGSEDIFKDIGPKGWDPLLYLCFSRLPLPAVTKNAVAIATLLLDHGANPNSYFMAGDSRYTPLVGAIGEGEEGRPPHQCRDELVDLLLERGAEPYDIQVIYNIHFEGRVQWFLEKIYRRSVALGRGADWDDPNWSMLEMGNYGNGARWHLGIAVTNNDLSLARWCLDHGASPNPPPAAASRLSRLSLYEEAMRLGFADMAELLASRGAPRSAIQLSGDAIFAAACDRLDEAAARAMVAEHPEYLLNAAPMLRAATKDRADVVELLLSLGMSPNVEDSQKQRGLHAAAYADAVNVGRLLLQRGADVDPVESNWGNTPLDAAIYAQAPRMIELLSGVSNYLWGLTFIGAVDRVRELVRDKPERARAGDEHNTLLMWLPGNEERALDVVNLLLEHGANPRVKDKDGATAADRAEKRGLYKVAERLREAQAGDRRTASDYEAMAADLLEAYDTGAPDVMERVWNNTWHRRPWRGMRTYMQLDLGKRPSAEGEDVPLTIDDTRLLIARERGFESWQALIDFAAQRAQSGAMLAESPVHAVRRGLSGSRRLAVASRDWNEIAEAIRDGDIDGIEAHGQMTDDSLDLISRTANIRRLDLSSSKRLTDAGLRALAHMPRLEELNLSNCPISDAGLAVLRELPELRRLNLFWNGAVTDAGIGHVRECHKLERINLMGTSTGDGALRALSGKPSLMHFQSGNGMTDAGVRLLHEIPSFVEWRGVEPRLGLLGYLPDATHVSMRGSITDRGMESLVGLDGLFGLNIDQSGMAVTPAGLRPLVKLAHLGFLAYDATDEAMPIIASLPHLRRLGCQDTTAGDEGFVALSASRTLEYLWGRRCYNLGSRGFAALGHIPTLKGFAVSCKNVGDEAIAMLPDFPSLVELMPMDVPDAGYRHVGKCARLESLVLMYCRETTDAATEHLVSLPRLAKYFASYTRATDRTPELLSRIESLESITLDGVASLTDAGIRSLARLPRLRELRLDGMPKVTSAAAAAFPARVDVIYSS